MPAILEAEMRSSCRTAVPCDSYQCVWRYDGCYGTSTLCTVCMSSTLERISLKSRVDSGLEA
jgi:hypothetical protein